MPDTSVITVCLNPTIDRVIEVDGFTIGAHQVGREILRAPGGKAINVSRVLAALGVRSVATGFLGADNRTGFDAVLDDPLVADEFFALPGRTRENVTITDRRTRQETHIRDVGLAVDPRSLDRLMRKLSLMSRPGNVVVFSGSLPPGIDAEDFDRMVTGCIEAGAHVAVDTSGPALRTMAGKSLWLVKPNAPELAELAGRELADLDEQLATARALTADVRHVLLTRGGEGAYLLTGALAVHARADVDPALLRNTVGCGDALLGAFVGATCRGLSARDALVEAIAVATASACHVAVAAFEPDLVAELREKVQLTDLPAA